jgi:hypothetical protein
MSEDVSWIRSYVLEEADGSIGTVCIYQAISPEAIRAHASAAGLPIDEIITIGDTLIVRADPSAAQRSVVPSRNMGSPADEGLTPAS